MSQKNSLSRTSSHIHYTITKIVYAIEFKITIERRKGIIIQFILNYTFIIINNEIEIERQ